MKKKQAETFLALQAECPNCNAIEEVGLCDESVDGLEDWVCEHCNEYFTYCHPGNLYGLDR